MSKIAEKVFDAVLDVVFDSVFRRKFYHRHRVSAPRKNETSQRRKERKALEGATMFHILVFAFSWNMDKLVDFVSEIFLSNAALPAKIITQSPTAFSRTHESNHNQKSSTALLEKHCHTNKHANRSEASITAVVLVHHLHVGPCLLGPVVLAAQVHVELLGAVRPLVAQVAVELATVRSWNAWQVSENKNWERASQLAAKPEEKQESNNYQSGFS